MKPWYQSKLIWIGAAMVAEAGLTAFINGGTWKEVVMAVAGAAVIVLRKYFTDTAIEG